ncbi:rhomboid family intramembrane serine protease [bacterium]|nr:MAG: rhomboid family intramembrane serine protease [bacterium]
MIPIRDINPSRKFPLVTLTLIGVNIAVFLYQLQAGEKIVYAFGLVPARISHLSSLYTFITCMFLHGGWFHLLGNMLYLWIFGDNVEDRMGRIPFLIFYILVGVLGSLAYLALHPSSTIPLIGASGAISGVMGAYFLFFPRASIISLVPLFFFIRIIVLPAWFYLGFWVLIQIASLPGESPVAFSAHLGGFFSGLLLAKVFERRPSRMRRRRGFL